MAITLSSANHRLALPLGRPDKRARRELSQLVSLRSRPMLHARPEPSHSARFAFNCALPLSSGPFRRPVKALLALKEDFSEYARPGRRRCHVYDEKGEEAFSEIGPSRCARNGCELEGRHVYREEDRIVKGRGESGSLTSDRAPFRRTPFEGSCFPRDFRFFRTSGNLNSFIEICISCSLENVYCSQLFSK